MTPEQRQWLQDHPDFAPAGPPRPVKFVEVGNLYPDGTYEPMDRGAGLRKPIDLSRRPLLIARYADSEPKIIFHAIPDPDACKHEWGGWREFEDGRGGEQVCKICSMGAMTYSLRTGL